MGAAGEDAAADWYETAGYRVLDRNWRCRMGELDIVASRRGVVVFAEVKTRTTARFGSGAEAVGRAKQQRIRRLAAEWLRASRRRWRRIRFDVVDVDGHGRIDVFEDCF